MDTDMSIETSPRERASNDADERRREVAQVAAELFGAGGYHKTTLDDIAAEMGLRKPTLYHYFKSKEEILYWIHEDFIDHLIACQERRASLDFTMTQVVQEVIRDMVDAMDTHRGYVSTVLKYHHELSPEHAATITSKRQAYAEAVEDVFRRGVETGEFRKLDPQIATRALFGMCNWTSQWYRPNGPLLSREIAYSFWDLILHGATRNADERLP